MSKANGEECHDHSECGKESYCNKTTNICEPLKEEGSECKADYECDYMLYCFPSKEKNSTCQRPFTLKPGSKAELGFYCESGTKNDNEICVESKLKRKEKGCDTDDDCIYSVYDGKETKDLKGTCLNNYNKTKVCTISSDPSVVDKKKKIIEIFTKNYQKGKIHVSGKRDDIWDLGIIMYDLEDRPYGFNGLDSCAIDYRVGYKLLSSYIKVSVWGIAILLSLLL